MSQITENTILIKTSDESKFKEQFYHHSDDFYLDNLAEVFRNNDFIIYVFDCNGDNPWYMGSARLDYEILEIYYGGNERLTEIRGVLSLTYEVRSSFMQNLSRKFPDLTPDELKYIEDKVKYTF